LSAKVELINMMLRLSKFYVGYQKSPVYSIWAKLYHFCSTERILGAWI